MSEQHTADYDAVLNDMLGALGQAVEAAKADRRSAEDDAPTRGHWCYEQQRTTLPATTPCCPQCGALNLRGARILPPGGSDA